MAPKLSSVLGFHEREQLHKNSSILAYNGDAGQNYQDIGDGYGEQGREQEAPSRRNASVEQKKRTSSSRLNLLSSSLHRARTAMASRAKKLHVRDSTRQAISQLRKTVAKGVSSRNEQSKENFQPPSNQYDNDHFNSNENQSGVENASFECMYAEVSLGSETEFRSSSTSSKDRLSTTSKDRLSRLLPPRPWIKSSKLKRRSSVELYMY